MLTARPWERELVTAARASGLARVVERCTDAASLERAASGSDVLFIGTDTPWLSPERLGRLLRWSRVVGVVEGDRDPMARILSLGGATVMDESLPARQKLVSILALSASSTDRSPCTTITVTGPRGAPGRSEIALALAWASSSNTLLVELDREAPGLGLRCALPPPEDPMRLQTLEVGRLSVLAPSLWDGPLSGSILQHTIEAARSIHQTVILDVGPNAATITGEAVVVCEPTPIGIVRCARLLGSWTGPEPLLVVNRATADTNVGLIRRATGLEPSALIPECERPEPGEPPPPAVLRALESIEWKRALIDAAPA